MYQDIFRDTPAYQHILAIGREEGLEEGREKGLEEGREEVQQRRLLSLRPKLLTLVQTRFPKLKTLMRGQIAIIQEPEILEDLLLKVAIAQTQEEAQDYLLSWDAQDDEL